MEPEYVRLVKETDICKQCTQIVIGKGNPEADILFVGEAPGQQEDEQGIPFVGRAGKNLDALLAKVGLSLDDIYVANILKCRPPGNRDPLPEEIRAHTPWLVHQINTIRPKVICSLGNYATKFFLANGDVDAMPSMPGITQVHGRARTITFQGQPITLIPLFHPAAIIYKQALLPLWEADMELVKKALSQRTLF